MATACIARMSPGYQHTCLDDVETAQERVGGSWRSPTQSPQAPAMLQAAAHRMIKHRTWLTTIVAASLVACGMLTLMPAVLPVPSESDASALVRRLEDTLFTDMQIVAPLIAVCVSVLVNVLAVLGAGGEGPGVFVNLMKFAFVDSVDQLVSIYLVVWVFEVDVGSGCKALAVLAAFIGNLAFLAHSFSLQQLIRGNYGPFAMTNGAGLLADLCSVGCMAAIEMTAEEKDLLPGWLKGLDWLWSVLGVIGEMYAIMSCMNRKSES